MARSRGSIDVADVAEGLALEDLEGDGRDQVRVAGEGDDLDDCSPMSVRTTSGLPSPLRSPTARSASRASLRLRLVAGERLEPLALLAGQDDAEAVGAGEQQVVAAVAVEVGDVHPLEVDRADREGAAGPVDAVLLREEQERLGGPVEQDDLLDAVAVGVERGGAEDLRPSSGRCCTGP